jgi:20S proteasome subunit beta 1
VDERGATEATRKGPEEATGCASRASALLASFGVQRYGIEWGGFLTNHLAHGLIALEMLGATRGMQERFHASYIDRLASRRPSSAASPRLKQSSLGSLPLGRRQYFGSIERAFDRAIAGASRAQLRAVVSEHLPRLVDGLAGAAFHAVLHLGLGVRTECRSLITEGLAYLAHSWLPVGGSAQLSDAGSGEIGVLESFEAVRREDGLQQRLVEAWPAVSSLPTGYFQRCMHAFAAVDGSDVTANAAAELRACADRCKLPDDPEAAGAALLDASLQLFVRSPGNDYFMLHGVTAAFNLGTLLPLLEPAVALRACRRMLLALLATYAAQRCPALCPAEECTYWPQGDIGAAAWEELRLEAVAPDQELRNEHAYKLCFLCMEQRKQASGMGPSERLMYCAARKVLSAPFTGRDGEIPLAAAATGCVQVESPGSSPYIRSLRSV